MIQASLKNPHLVIVAALATLVLGLFTYSKIPADLLPQFETSAVQIVTFYPGMPPEVMEVVPNEQMDEQALYDIAYYELRNKLQSIQGVIWPAVHGGKLRRISAYVDREKLAAYGMSLMDVQRALLKQNLLIPAGSIKIGKQELQIFTNANVDRVEQLNDVPIKVFGDVPILMSDIGEVRNASQIQTNIVRVNGARKAYIPIYRQPGANTIDIVRQINRQLRDIEERLKVEKSDDPKMATLVLSVAMDQSIGIATGNRSLQLAAGLGAALAGLVVLVFLRSFRSTLIIVLVIPLAILASIFVMYFTGDTINAMTLGGLALAIGILVDQSIVVLENVVRHVQMGKTSAQAALDGTSEVAMPMLVSTMTFAIVFFPVVFLSGLAKFLFTPLAVAATIAIFASYALAITLVPAYCARFLGSNQAPQDVDPGRGLAAKYETLLGGVLKLRYLVVILAVAGFVASLYMMSQHMGRELFPQVDSGQVTIFVRMPTGTRIEVTEEQIIQIEQDIIDLFGEPDPAFAVGNEEKPESNLQLLISNIGVLMDWPAAYTPNSGAMDSFMLVQTKSKPGKPNIFEYVQTLRETLTKKYPDVEFSFDTGGMLTAALNMGEPAPIHFQIQAPNLETGQDVAKIIEDAARSVAGATDVRTAQRIDYPILQINMDRELAARQGLTPDEVMKNLVSATNSSINFEPSFWIDKAKGNHYFFGVQYREEDLNSLETLLNIPVGGDQYGPRRLGNVATIEQTTGPAVINHRNITRVTDVYANIEPGFDVGGIVDEIELKLADLGAWPDTNERGAFQRLGPILVNDGDSPALTKAKEAHNDLPLGQEAFKGLSYRMLGEVRSMRESFAQFLGGLLLAAVLVYLVMVAQFRSFMDPLIVLLTVPLGFIGVVAVLLATGTHLSIMSFMGIIMMVGIVVEYSIVLVDFANRRVEDGLGIEKAIREAARVRCRPILMTSLTTWLALLPMAIGFGGGEANAPLARAIIGGVISATVLSLLVVPCLYVMLKRPPKPSTAEA